MSTVSGATYTTHKDTKLSSSGESTHKTSNALSVAYKLTMSSSGSRHEDEEQQDQDHDVHNKDTKENGDVNVVCNSTTQTEPFIDTEFGGVENRASKDVNKSTWVGKRARKQLVSIDTKTSDPSNSSGHMTSLEQALERGKQEFAALHKHSTSFLESDNTPLDVIVPDSSHSQQHNDDDIVHDGAHKEDNGDKSVKKKNKEKKREKKKNRKKKRNNKASRPRRKTASERRVDEMKVFRKEHGDRLKRMPWTIRHRKTIGSQKFIFSFVLAVWLFISIINLSVCMCVCVCRLFQCVSLFVYYL